MNTILYVYPATITLLTMVMYFWTMWRVGQARARHRIMPPRTDGPEEFLRVFRVQQNTLEQVVLFLPSLWLFALFISYLWAGILGAVWLAARVWYAIAYSRAAEKRLPPFLFALFTTVVLMGGAGIGIIGAWMVL